MDSSDSLDSSHYSVEKLYIFSHSLDAKLLADSCFLSSYISIGLSMLYFLIFNETGFKNYYLKVLTIYGFIIRFNYVIFNKKNILYKSLIYLKYICVHTT